MDINWINEPEYFEDDTREIFIAPGAYDWREQPLVSMYHAVQHKRRTDIRRNGPLYRVMKSQGWVDMGTEQS